MLIRVLRGVAACIALLLLVNSVAVGAADEQAKAAQSTTESNVEIVTEAKANLAHANALSNAFRAAAAKMLPSVVTIRARTQPPQRPGVLRILESEEHDRFESLGSGVIITSEGLVVTNNHVVANASEVRVQLSSGKQYSAKDIRTDPRSDLAILHLEASESFQAAEIGDSDELMVGDWVLAIGSPFELNSTVSAGIISRKGSNISDLVRGQFLQTDAAVNPGNSGGPLVNLEGKVVGINTAISSQTGTFMGVGFAIPMNRANWVKDELLAHGKVRRALLGIRTRSIPQDVAEKLAIDMHSGAYVDLVYFGRPAQKAGIKVGDVIIKLADQAISSYSMLAEIVEQCPAGQPLQLDLLRDGERVELTIELEPVE